MLRTKRDFMDCLKNIINPKCEIKAVKYKIKKGINNVETVVIYPKS